MFCRLKEPEDNLHWYLWDSMEDDVTTNFREKTNANDAKGSSTWMDFFLKLFNIQSFLFFVDLTIKSLGLSPNSGKLCIFLESLISTVAVELSNMNSEKGLDSEQATILKHHQQSCCIELIKKLVQVFVSLN